MKKALISGITGQDGSYLAEFLISKGYKIHGIMRRSSSFNTERVDHLMNDPEIWGKSFFLHYGDLTDSSNLNDLVRIIQPDEIYNLGAQSHVKVSFEVPEYSADTNGLGCLRLLDAMYKNCPNARFYQASTSEMCGGQENEMPENGFTETTSFHPRSPYGVAKLYAYWIVRNYRESYGLHVSNGILFNHECFDANTPITIKKDGIIDVTYIRNLLPERKNISKDKNVITSNLTDKNIEIWNGEKFTKLLTATRRKLSTLDKENKTKVVSNTKNGSVVTTPNHNFIINGNKIPQKDLSLNSELDHGDFPKLNSKIKMTIAEAKFLGMLVRDGFVSVGGDIRLTNLDYKEIFTDLVNEIFCRPNIRQSEYISSFNGKTTYIDIYDVNKNIGKYYRDEIYDKRTKHKKIPSRILNASKEIKKSFLEGYYICDGLKKDKCVYKFKSFKSNSPLLCQGLLLLISEITDDLNFNINTFQQNSMLYNQVNLNSDVNPHKKGKHLKKPRHSLKKTIDLNYESCFVYDVETDCGFLQAGVGNMVVGNSPRRGDTFVTKKITNWCKKWKSANGNIEPIELGNIHAYRDWGHAKDFIEAQWLILQQNTPDDYVIATGETYTVKQFIEECFNVMDKEITWEGEGLDEKGICDGKTVLIVNPKYFRPAEVDILLGDSTKARNTLGWKPKYSFKELVKDMMEN